MKEDPVEAVAKAVWPDLWHGDPHTVHREARPLTVEAARHARIESIRPIIAAARSVIVGDMWQPIEVTTPPKWHQFFGRQIGTTTLGAMAAFCPTAWYFGVELLTGSCRGVALCLGPIWAGFAVLRKSPKAGDHSGTQGLSGGGLDAVVSTAPIGEWVDIHSVDIVDDEPSLRPRESPR